MMKTRSRLHAGLYCLGFVCLASSPAFSQPADDAEKMLSFAEAWIDPRDYVWNRTSASRFDSRSNSSVEIRDFGRVRIEFLSREDESVILKPRILKLHYETKLPGENTLERVSPLEGQEIPTVWLHWALGFSVEVAPGRGSNLGNNHQAMEVLDLLDFRGFVPQAIPAPKAEWKATTHLPPDADRHFREEMERRFLCRSIETVGDQTLCVVEFSETLKITATDSERSSELRETKGTYKILMPKGRVEEARWTTESTEFVNVRGNKGRIVTDTEVSIQSRDTSPPKRRNPVRKKAPSAVPVPTELPRPPR